LLADLIADGLPT